MKLGNIAIGGMSLGSVRIGGAKLGNTLVFNGNPYRRLPSGYTERAYVETDSDAWVDTGVSGTTDLNVTIRFSAGKYVQYAAFYGNWPDDSHKCCRAIINNETSLIVAGGNSRATVIQGFSRNRIHTLSVKSNEAYLESVRSSIPSSSNTANTANICLGNRSTTAPISRDIGLRIYAFYIVKSGTLVLNYVPATRDLDGAVGFYDLIGETFVKSLTGTEFTAGPVAEYSGKMLKCLEWRGADALDSGKWYDTIGNQYWTLTGGTHNADNYEFINNDPEVASEYASLFAALPDLGYHWKIIIDVAVRHQSNDPSTFIPVDFGAYGSSGTGTCALSFMISGAHNWTMQPKFNGNSSASDYYPDWTGRPVEPDFEEPVGTWIHRRVEVGVKASSVSGKSKTVMSISGLWSGESETPWDALRFNRWVDASSFLARGMQSPSSSYRVATSTRVYSIKVFYEPLV